MLKSWITPLLITLLSLPAAVQGADTAENLAGPWKNVDAKTRGITRLNIARSDDDEGYVIEAWGACHPTDCKWEKVPLHTFAPSLSEERQAIGLATWEPGFKRTHLTLELRDGELHATSYSIFLDKSKRTSYYSQYRFKRAVTAEATATRAPAD